MSANLLTHNSSKTEFFILEKQLSKIGIAQYHSFFGLSLMNIVLSPVWRRKLKPKRAVGKMVNGKWLPDFIERLKVSAWHQLYLPLLPFTHARSESINADSLKLQLLTAPMKEYSYKASCTRPSCVIFDIWALWRSALSVRVPGYQKLQMEA